jgi:hypothetical protein
VKSVARRCHAGRRCIPSAQRKSRVRCKAARARPPSGQTTAPGFAQPILGRLVVFQRHRAALPLPEPAKASRETRKIS